ncbi:MAG: sodium/proton-translocating pyrophosphatase, partial [Pirellula staleyi]
MNCRSAFFKRNLSLFAVLLFSTFLVGTSFSQGPETAIHSPGGEANLVLPDLGGTNFLGVPGNVILYGGLVVSAAGLFFGIRICKEIHDMPVHSSMREVSDLIYETCKTYLINQGKFLAVLWTIIALVIVLYFGWLSQKSSTVVGLIVGFSIVGIL